jgi:hypothetical protein
MRTLAVVLVVVVAQGCNCGDEAGRDAGVTADAGPLCQVDGGVSLAITTPTRFACQAQYTATFQLINTGCQSVTVSALHIRQARSSGVCAPGPFTSDYVPTTASVRAASTATVLDLKSAPFCCTAPGCPADYACAYDFVFTADTSAGVATASSSATLQLASCNVLCP